MRLADGGDMAELVRVLAAGVLARAAVHVSSPAPLPAGVLALATAPNAIQDSVLPIRDIRVETRRGLARTRGDRPSRSCPPGRRRPLGARPDPRRGARRRHLGRTRDRVWPRGDAAVPQGAGGVDHGAPVRQPGSGHVGAGGLAEPTALVRPRARLVPRRARGRHRCRACGFGRRRTAPPPGPPARRCHETTRRMCRCGRAFR